MKLTTLKDGKVKAIVTIPGWAERYNEGLSSTDKISSTERAYALVPLIFRAVRLRCNALTKVPFHFYNAGGDEVDSPIPQNINEMIWNTEAALLLCGAGYWLKRDTSKFRLKKYGVQFLNPLTMKVKQSDTVRNVDTDLPALEFTQEYKGMAKVFPEDSIVYFRDYNPADDIGPGISATQVALTNAALLHYLELFAGTFFENGAMPVTLLGISGLVDKDERERVEGFFKRAISGIRNAFKVQAINSDSISATTLTQPLKDLVIPELHIQARKNVALAFDIPVTLLDDDANYATASEHRKSFWEDTIQPRANKLQAALNQQLFKPHFGLEFSFAFDEMEMFQADEERRSSSYYTYVNAGMKPSIAAQILGIDLPEGMEYRDLDKAENITNMLIDESDNRDVVEEMKAWMRFELRRLGKNSKREFKPKLIPSAMHAAICGQLEGVKTESEIRSIFRSASAWRAYP